jgi:spermidine synthase
MPTKIAQKPLALSGRKNLRNTVLSFCGPPDADRDAIFDGLLDGSYTKPFVIEESGYRSLCFALDGPLQTEMLLNEPDALATEYTRKMMGFLVFQPHAQDVVLIGLGGGALVKYCYRRLSTTRITAVEIDPDVIALRSHFYIPPDDERLRVIQADGAHHVAQMAQRGEHVDALLVDAYNHLGIADAVVTRTFIESAKQVVGERGVLVMNLVAEPKDCKRYVERIQQVFETPVIVVATRQSGNLIAFAGQALADSSRLKLAIQNVERVQIRFGLWFPTLLQRLHELADPRSTGVQINDGPALQRHRFARES